MSNFSTKYVTTNNKAGSPAFDPAFINSLRHSLIEEAPELSGIIDAILMSLAIGAHRADIAVHLFEQVLLPVKADVPTGARGALATFRAVVMIVWPFVGIPWCVPAILGVVDVLNRNNVGNLAGDPASSLLDDQDTENGIVLMKRTYATVNNTEVQEMLRIFFPDFANLTWTVVFGSMARITSTGIFEEKQSQLILASAIASSGALRQARSHMKASIGLGNSVAAVGAIAKAAVRLNAWNGTIITGVDVSEF